MSVSVSASLPPASRGHSPFARVLAEDDGRVLFRHRCRCLRADRQTFAAAARTQPAGKFARTERLDVASGPSPVGQHRLVIWRSPLTVTTPRVCTVRAQDQRARAAAL